MTWHGNKDDQNNRSSFDKTWYPLPFVWWYQKWGRVARGRRFRAQFDDKSKLDHHAIHIIESLDKLLNKI